MQYFDLILFMKGQGGEPRGGIVFRKSIVLFFPFHPYEIYFLQEND